MPEIKVLVKNVMVMFLTIILCLDCFNNFAISGIGMLFLNGIKIVSLLFSAFYIYLFRDELNEKDVVLALLLIPFFWIYYFDFDFLKGTLKVISRIVPAMLFLIMDVSSKLKLSKRFLTFFVFSLIPGLIIHVLKHFFSVQFPVTEMTGYEGKLFDTHFLLYWYYHYNPIRFCGIYDEPGVVGTFSILFLIYWNESMKKYQKVVLWIAGISSLSFFFFLMTPLCLTKNYLQKKKYISIFMMLGIFLSIFIFKDSIVNSLLDSTGRSQVEKDLIFHVISTRVSVDEGNKVEGVKSNRMESNNYQFKDFIKEDIPTILFGNFYAKGDLEFVKTTLGGLGIELFLYNYGILLFAYAILFVFLINRLPKKNNFFFMLFSFIIVMLCFYQRPFIYRIEFIAIVYTGILLNSSSYNNLVRSGSSRIEDDTDCKN